MTIRLDIRLPASAHELAYGDEVTADEIYLVESNDAGLYRQMVRPTVLNYARKMKKGTYIETLALEEIQNHLVPEAIRRYKKDQGDIGPVSAAIKKAIARRWLRHIQEEAESAVKYGEV